MRTPRHWFTYLCPVTPSKEDLCFLVSHYTGGCLFEREDRGRLLGHSMSVFLRPGFPLRLPFLCDTCHVVRGRPFVFTESRRG